MSALRRLRTNRADTGNAKVDALGDIFNAKLALFTDVPPAEQGALGWVSKAVQVGWP